MREERFTEQIFSHSSQDKSSAQLLARTAVTLAFPYPEGASIGGRQKPKRKEEQQKTLTAFPPSLGDNEIIEAVMLDGQEEKG